MLREKPECQLLQIQINYKSYLKVLQNEREKTTNRHYIS